MKTKPKPGDLMWLFEDDCFKTVTRVTVIRVKGESVFVLDGDRKRETNINKLASRTNNEN